MQVALSREAHLRLAVSRALAAPVASSLPFYGLFLDDLGVVLSDPRDGNLKVL